MTDNTAFYFGCYRESGHRPFAEDMIPQRWFRPSSPKHPVPWDEVDGGLCPQKKGLWKQGAVQLQHKDGWTALGFWDYTVDTRPGSHSTFFMKGNFSFEEMKALCAEKFPEVWKRFDFEISLI